MKTITPSIDFREVHALELQGIPFPRLMEMTGEQIKEKVMELRKSTQPTGGESFSKNVKRPTERSKTIEEWQRLKVDIDNLQRQLSTAEEKDKPVIEKKLQQRLGDAEHLKNKAQNLYKLDLGSINL